MYSDNGLFGVRGFPDDACDALVRERDRWKGDGHSHSWALVSEFLAAPEIDHYEQVRWMRANIAEPEHTRMVFWFDN